MFFPLETRKTLIFWPSPFSFWSTANFNLRWEFEPNIHWSLSWNFPSVFTVRVIFSSSKKGRHLKKICREVEKNFALEPLVVNAFGSILKIHCRRRASYLNIVVHHTWTLFYFILEHCCTSFLNIVLHHSWTLPCINASYRNITLEHCLLRSGSPSRSLFSSWCSWCSVLHHRVYELQFPANLNLISVENDSKYFRNNIFVRRYCAKTLNPFDLKFWGVLDMYPTCTLSYNLTQYQHASSHL